MGWSPQRPLALATFVSSPHRLRKRHSLAREEQLRWAMGAPQLSATGVPFSRCSRFQFPRGKKKGHHGLDRGRRRDPCATPKHRPPTLRTECWDGTLSVTSSCSQRNLFSGEVVAVERCRSATKPGVRVLVAELMVGGYLDGEVHLRRLSSLTPLNQALSADPTCQVELPGCSERQLKSRPDQALTVGRSSRCLSSWSGLGVSTRKQEATASLW